MRAGRDKPTARLYGVYSLYLKLFSQEKNYTNFISEWIKRILRENLFWSQDFELLRYLSYKLTNLFTEILTKITTLHTSHFTFSKICRKKGKQIPLKIIWCTCFIASVLLNVHLSFAPTRFLCLHQWGEIWCYWEAASWSCRTPHHGLSLLLFSNPFETLC